jgi:hypothetical protein
MPAQHTGSDLARIDHSSIVSNKKVSRGTHPNERKPRWQRHNTNSTSAMLFSAECCLH